MTTKPPAVIGDGRLNIIRRNGQMYFLHGEHGVFFFFASSVSISVTISFPSSGLFHEQVIHITPSPIFPWFDRADDGMAGRVKMLRGVFVLGGITASDVATGEAHSQMDPAVIHGYTFLADSGVPVSHCGSDRDGCRIIGT